MRSGDDYAHPAARSWNGRDAESGQQALVLPACLEETQGHGDAMALSFEKKQGGFRLRAWGTGAAPWLTTMD